MINNTIEEAKDLVASYRVFLGEDCVSALQKLLTQVRSELLHLDAKAIEACARQDVYADVCNKLLDRLANRDD